MEVIDHVDLRQLAAHSLFKTLSLKASKKWALSIYFPAKSPVLARQATLLNRSTILSNFQALTLSFAAARGRVIQS